MDNVLTTKYSRYYEEFASEFLENFEVMFLRYYIHSDICNRFKLAELKLLFCVARIEGLITFIQRKNTICSLLLGISQVDNPSKTGNNNVFGDLNQLDASMCMRYRRNISSRLARNSEAFTLEILENVVFLLTVSC